MMDDVIRIDMTVADSDDVTSIDMDDVTSIDMTVADSDDVTSIDMDDVTSIDMTVAESGVTSISFQIVDKLPTTGTNGVFYLVSDKHSDSSDAYDEYVWISATSKFEKIGNTDVDLSGYIKQSDITAITTAEIDTIAV